MLYVNDLTIKENEMKIFNTSGELILKTNLESLSDANLRGANLRDAYSRAA